MKLFMPMHFSSLLNFMLNLMFNDCDYMMVNLNLRDLAILAHSAMDFK